MIAVADPPNAGQSVGNRIAELQQTVSASGLSFWLSCRLKFYFRYVIRILKPPASSMHAGSTVHAVLQAWNLARWRREPFEVARYKSVFQAQWIALQQGVKICWAGEEAAERSFAWLALEHYFTETPIKAEEKPEAVEVRVDADLSSHGLPTLVGIIDLVRAGGRIVDFKVVGKTPDAELLLHTHELQLTCYSLLYRDATGKAEAGLELHHLVKTKVPKFILTSLPAASVHQQTRLFRQIESYQAGLNRQDFVPSPSFMCAGCEYNPECHRWPG